MGVGANFPEHIILRFKKYKMILQHIQSKFFALTRAYKILGF
jgi:hypothetical protein